MSINTDESVQLETLSMHYLLWAQTLEHPSLIHCVEEYPFLLCIGAYCVYDGMTFSEEEQTSMFGRVKNFFRSSAEEQPLRVPSHSQAQEDSLLIFLGSHEKKLKELNFSINSEVNFLQCVNNIFQIYEQLRCQKILKDNLRPDDRMAASLAMVGHVISMLWVGYLLSGFFVAVLYSGTPKCGHLWDLEKVS